MKKFALIFITFCSVYSTYGQDNRFTKYISIDEKISFLIPKTWSLKNDDKKIITYESAEKEDLISVATLKVRILHPSEFNTLDDYLVKRSSILYSFFDIEPLDDKTIKDINYKTYEVRHGIISKNYKAIFYITLINNRFYMIETDLSVKKFRTYTPIFNIIINSLEIQAK